MNFFRRAIVVAICIDFCLVFLPVDLLLSNFIERVRYAINLIVLAAILFEDRGGGGGKRKRHEDSEEGKKRKEKLKLATGNA